MLGRLLPDDGRDRDVEGGDDDRGEGESPGRVLDQADLERERYSGQAEDQGSVDDAAALLRALHGVKDRDGRVEHEEEREEELCPGVVLGLVSRQTPGGAHEERAGEAQEVQDAPILEPGDRENTGVEDRVVGEEADEVAAVVRGQDRREKTAQDAQHREGQRVLHDGEEGGRDREDHEHRERRAVRDERVDLQRREGDEIDGADAAALQAHGVSETFRA